VVLHWHDILRRDQPSLLILIGLHFSRKVEQSCGGSIIKTVLILW